MVLWFEYVCYSMGGSFYRGFVVRMLFIVILLVGNIRVVFVVKN